MLKIYNNERVETEREYLALLLNKPALISISQIKSEYLCEKKNQKLFEYVKECYEEIEYIDPRKIGEKHRDFDVNYFVEILMDTFWNQRAWKSQMERSEESIVKFYKEDVIKRLNERLEQGTVTYDKFMQQMRTLDDIVLTDKSTILTERELLDGINEEQARINFNQYARMNKMLGMVRGDFLIIGATTGTGKSSFMLNLMNDLMNSFQCIYFNMEMSRSTIYKRIASIKANIPMECLNNPKSEYQKQEINKALKKIEESKLIVEHKANDIKAIKTILMKLKDKERHTILFIDHLGLTKVDSNKTLYEQATQVAKELRQMCLEYDCTVIGASQLNRSAYGNEEISLSMLKDSGELENSASKVILLKKSNKDDSDNVINMDIIIAKNRDGICGNIKMEYDKTKQVFKEVNNGYSS